MVLSSKQIAAIAYKNAQKKCPDATIYRPSKAKKRKAAKKGHEAYHGPGTPSKAAVKKWLASSSGPHEPPLAPHLAPPKPALPSAPPPDKAKFDAARRGPKRKVMMKEGEMAWGHKGGHTYLGAAGDMSSRLYMPKKGTPFTLKF